MKRVRSPSGFSLTELLVVLDTGTVGTATPVSIELNGAYGDSAITLTGTDPLFAPPPFDGTKVSNLMLESNPKARVVYVHSELFVNDTWHPWFARLRREAPGFPTARSPRTRSSSPRGGAPRCGSASSTCPGW